MCQQKDDINNKLHATVDATVEDATRDVNTPSLTIMVNKQVVLKHGEKCCLKKQECILTDKIKSEYLNLITLKNTD